LQRVVDCSAWTAAKGSGQQHNASQMVVNKVVTRLTEGTTTFLCNFVTGGRVATDAVRALPSLCVAFLLGDIYNMYRSSELTTR